MRYFCGIALIVFRARLDGEVYVLSRVLCANRREVWSNDGRIRRPSLLQKNVYFPRLRLRRKGGMSRSSLLLPKLGDWRGCGAGWRGCGAGC
jgi:hypothetical protein